jgi:hypothetical protein
MPPRQEISTAGTSFGALTAQVGRGRRRIATGMGGLRRPYEPHRSPIAGRGVRRAEPAFGDRAATLEYGRLRRALGDLTARVVAEVDRPGVTMCCFDRLGTA